MSKNRFIYLMSALVSASAWGSSFQDLDQSLLKDYFNQNSISSGLSCQLSDEKILASYQHSSIPSSYADCFIQDTSGYIIKMSSSCPAGTINGKLKAAAGTFCVTSTASSGGGSASGSKKDSKSGAGAGLQMQDIVQATAMTATAAQQYAKSIAAEKKAAGTTAATASAPTTETANTNFRKSEIAEQNASAAKPAVTPTTETANTNFRKSEIAEQNASALKSGEEIKLSNGETLKFDKPSGSFLNSDGDAVKYENIKDLCTGSCKTSMDRLPAEAQGPAAKLAENPPANATEIIDPAAVAAGQAGQAAATTGSSNMAATTAAVNNETCQTLATKVKTNAEKYKAEMISCTADAATADNLCQITRSPKAILVQQLMTVGTGLLSKMSSASETCGTTSDLSSVAQMGMTAASLMCSGMKFKCESSCTTADATLKLIKADSAQMKSCGIGLAAQGKAEIASSYGTNPKGTFDVTQGTTTQTASTSLDGVITKEEAAVAAVTLQCNKYSADIMQMATQAMGLMMAAEQAKDCEKKLTANDDGGSSGGGGGGVGGKPSAITTTQLCSDPKNATMQICKCNASATAEGCPGAIAKLTTTSSPSFKSTGNGSQMAGPDAAFKQGSNLSAAAKSALGINPDGINNGSANSAGLGFNGGGTSGTDSNAAGAHGSANQKTDTAGSSKEKSKFNLGSFSSLGGAIGGFFGGSKKSGGSEKSSKDQIESAKRQIASEKVRSEISSASGRSNWDKVSTRYTESTSTFLGQ